MNKQVLLVDNDAEVIELNKNAFEKSGFQVKVAGTANEALEKLESSKPDLIITEIMLEHSDSGFSLCYNLKKKYPEIPVIILTDVVSKTGISFGLTTREEKEWIKADEFLDKPITPDNLVQKAKRFLG